MKKLFTTIIALCAITFTAHAQLKVLSTGQTVIEKDTCIQGATLTVGKPIYNNYPNYHFGLLSQVENLMVPGNYIGVSGKAEQTVGSVCIGVQGLASSPSSHRNYGVIGALGPIQNGAGVFGTTKTYQIGKPITGLYAGYFNGEVYADTLTTTVVITPSDMRLKENVTMLSEEEQRDGGTLESLMGLDVIHYNYAPRAVEEQGDTAQAAQTTEAQAEAKQSARHYGLSAQQLREIYPDLVIEGQDGYLGVNYVELVPILIRSIQQLKAEVEELRAAGTMGKSETEKNTIAGGQTEEKVMENKRLMLLK